MKKSRLGKGLEALIPKETIDTATSNDDLLNLPLGKIKPNKLQPRKSFDDPTLKELAESIKEKGVIQPLMVRRSGKDYEIVAGERRWRASKLAGIKNVPAILIDASDSEALQLALIENLQREDLNPIEEAEGYSTLVRDHNLTHEDISKKIGKDRSTITNQLRLLKLTDNAKKAVAGGVISAGHARALLSVEDGDMIDQLLNTVISRELSVRQTENLLKTLNKVKSGRKTTSVATEDSKYISDIAEELKKTLGTKVIISGGAEKGKIEIQYYSGEELERLIGILKSGR